MPLSQVPTLVADTLGSLLWHAGHTSTDVSLYALPSATGTARLCEIHNKTFDAAKAFVPRVDSRSLTDGAANDALLNKSFHLASYTLLSWACVLGWLARAGVRARGPARAAIAAAS
jgi:hypothetical protein